MAPPLKSQSMQCQLRPDPASGWDAEDDTVFEEEETEEEALEENEEGRWMEEVEELEEEVITRQDDGREPKDYNRRAQIFDESSKVFRSSKDRNGHRHDK